jgi:hypothetical protein
MRMFCDYCGVEIVAGDEVYILSTGTAYKVAEDGLLVCEKYIDPKIICTAECMASYLIHEAGKDVTQ